MCACACVSVCVCVCVCEWGEREMWGWEVGREYVFVFMCSFASVRDFFNGLAIILFAGSVW